VSLTPAKEKFAQSVASALGLELATVRTWVAAEGGPDDNPLNIMGWTARGQRYVRHFVTQEKAATATVNLLLTQTYDAVTGAARSGNVTTELKAIAASPWEENQYRGKTELEGGLLFGAFHSLYGKATGSTVQDVDVTIKPGPLHGLKIPLPGPDVTIDPLNPFGATKWLLEHLGISKHLGISNITTWLESELAKGLLYVVLTVLALGLCSLGLLRMIGASPTGLVRSLAPAKARTSGAQTDEIPF
jgi:hypothetical protein